MKVLIDTSVWLAGVLVSHPRHGQALPWLSRAKAREFNCFLSAHSLAEMYAVLTRLPTQPKVSPALAIRLIEENLISCSTIIALTSVDYVRLINEAAEAGWSGGLVYDAVIVKAAKLADVDCLLTFNLKHFRQLWPECVGRVTAPDEAVPSQPGTN